MTGTGPGTSGAERHQMSCEPSRMVCTRRPEAAIARSAARCRVGVGVAADREIYPRFLQTVGTPATTDLSLAWTNVTHTPTVP